MADGGEVSVPILGQIEFFVDFSWVEGHAIDVHYPYNILPGYYAVVQSLDSNGELMDATQSQNHSGWQTAADQATTIQSKIIQVGCKP